MRLQLPPATRLPSYQRYAAIAAASADRPGGKRKAAVVEQRDREVVVGLANLEAMGPTRERVESAIGVSVGIADPAAAWMALCALRGGGPEVIVDDWGDPAQVIICDPKGSWIFSEVESIPRGSLGQRAAAVATILQQGVLTRRPVRTIGVAGRLVDAIDLLVANLGGDVEQIVPIPQAQPWWPSLGAALVAVSPRLEHSYEELRSDSTTTP
ncbi:hypothetical protein EPN42_04745 [bacterium]|nr:MAG: hypothetical protein EPN42_04745 [bacterium]